MKRAIATLVSKTRSRRDAASSILTKRQQEILDFIKGHIEKCGYPPTRHEIAVAFGFSSDNGAHQHVLCLVKKGYIRLQRGARAIEVVQ